MSKLWTPAIALALLVGGPSWATTYDVDISPAAGSALNLGATVYTQDQAIGLSALNAVGQPASPATGNEIGGGITYDDVTNVLSYQIGYGSDFGFVDLTGDYSIAHFHGPAAVQYPSVNTPAGIYSGQTLTAAHVAGSSPKTGSFSGTWVLTPSQEQDLFDNLIYANIHSSFAPGGEIRGQLVLVPEPTSLALLAMALVLLSGCRMRLA